MNDQQPSIDRSRRRAATLLAGLLLAVAGTIVAIAASSPASAASAREPPSARGTGGGSNDSSVRRRRRRKEAAATASAAVGGGGIVDGRRSALSISHPDPAGKTANACSALDKRDCRRDARCSYDKDSEACELGIPEVADTLGDIPGNCSAKKNRNACRRDPACEPYGSACVHKGLLRVASSGSDDDPCVGKNRPRCRNDASCEWRGRASGCSSRAAGSASAPAAPAVVPTIKWWPERAPDGAVECARSSDYPAMYAGLGRPMLFETREQCCAAYACSSDEPREDDPPPPSSPTFYDPMPRMDEPRRCVTGPSGDPCPSDWFCRAEGGACGDGLAGACSPRPAMCAAIYDPVCGCDGAAHSSACHAYMAGIDVMIAGECPKTATGAEDATVDIVAASPSAEGPTPGAELPVTSGEDARADDVPFVIIAGMPLPDVHAEDPPPPGASGHFNVGGCDSDADCADGLVCHAASEQCVCDPDTNAGCSTGQICGVPPGLYCPAGGCIPMCTCDHLSNALDGSNGCPAGEACRQPCAMADAGVMCFASERERDCDVYGRGYVCRDSNGDGVIDGRDGSTGCVRAVELAELVELERAPGAPPPRAGDGDNDGIVIVVDGANPYRSTPLDLEPSDLDHDHIPSLHDCSSRPWHESTTMEHVCTNDGDGPPEGWTSFQSGNECCDVVFHNAECHLIDVCEDLLLPGGDLHGDVRGGGMMSSTVVPLQVHAGGGPAVLGDPQGDSPSFGNDDTFTFATFAALEPHEEEEDPAPTPIRSDPRTFEVFPGVEVAGGGNTGGGGGHKPPLEDCSSVPWHATAEDDGNDEPASSCTNSGDYPEHWETAEGFLFKSAEDCCVARFSGSECRIADVCEEDGHASSIEPRAVEASRYGDSRGDDDTSDVPIMATVSALDATSSTVAAAAAAEVDTAELADDEPCRMEGHCRSPSGHCGPRVTCVEDPCADAACGTGTTCRANYCGGCHLVCSSVSEDAASVASAAGVSAGETDGTGGPPDEDGEEKFLLVESDLLDIEIDDLPWDYGGSPTRPEWHIDRDTWPTPTITNVDVPRTYPGATTDLTLRLRLPRPARLQCLARIETDMPFDYFIFLVDGEKRYVFPFEVEGIKPITTGLLEGDRTVVFRVENGDLDPGFDRDEYGGEHGSGSVWLDRCQILMQ